MLERSMVLNPTDFPDEWVNETVKALLEGAVVVHPTETVHGFGCRADNPEALKRIHNLKGRDPVKSFILLVQGVEWVGRFCPAPPSRALKLAETFWPGPLTIVSGTSPEARNEYPWLGETVALRQTPHPFTSRVVKNLGLPMVSTSLNRSGHPAPDDPLSFVKGLEGVVELAVIDPASAAGSAGKASSVVAVSADGRLEMLREGVLTAARIQAITGLEVRLENSHNG